MTKPIVTDPIETEQLVTLQIAIRKIIHLEIFGMGATLVFLTVAVSIALLSGSLVLSIFVLLCGAVVAGVTALLGQTERGRVLYNVSLQMLAGLPPKYLRTVPQFGFYGVRAQEQNHRVLAARAYQEVGSPALTARHFTSGSKILLLETWMKPLKSSKFVPGQTNVDAAFEDLLSSHRRFLRDELILAYVAQLNVGGI